MSEYRKDIDGLRAIAISVVFLFHANIPVIRNIVSGGFAGVDIFFVISGYLVSGALYAQLVRTGRLEIRQFYARRMRRILPAALVLYLGCLSMSALTSLGDEAEEIQGSVIAALFSVSNFYFASKAGYFDSSLLHNPLLHTWSLSVEEQFYIFLPIFFLLIARVSHRSRIIIMVGVAGVSFIWSTYAVHVMPAIAYYDPVGRAWEMMTGALLAIAMHWKIERRAAEIVAACGAVAIITGITCLNQGMSFPGPLALLPCLGACAIIYSGGQANTLVSRALSLQPMRFLGLISYSLYLWHWPIMVFAKTTAHLSTIEKVAVAIACFVVAIMSWALVEQPFRHRGNSSRPWPILAISVTAMAAVLAFSLEMVPANKMIWPRTSRVNHLIDVARFDTKAFMRAGQCFSESGRIEQSFDRAACMRLSTRKPNVLIFGDSHSAMYWQMLQKEFPGVNFLQASASGCLPIVGSPGTKNCLEVRNYVLNEFLPQHHVDGVIIAGYYWPETAETVHSAIDTANRLTAYANHVWILGINPTFDTRLPRLLMRAEYYGSSIVSEHEDRDVPLMEQIFTASHLGRGVSYVSYYSAMCAKFTCPVVTSSGDPVLFDNNHLSPSGADDVVRAWKARLDFGGALAPVGHASVW